MSNVPPNGMPALYPSMRYRDANAAIEWLECAFGFRRLLVVPGEDNTVAHAELATGTGVLMLGSTLPGSPGGGGGAPYVYVADVAEHCAQAKAAGAQITRELEEKDYGGSAYACLDCEGNEWHFGSYVPAPAFAMYSATPYLAVRDAEAAIAFYGRAFGAEESSERYTGEDGRIGHAELSVGPVTFYLADEHPEFGVVGPQTLSGRSSSIVLGVADVDASFRRAVQAGATVDREPEDEPYGRIAWIIDPFGHRWAMNGPVS